MRRTEHAFRDGVIKGKKNRPSKENFFFILIEIKIPKTGWFRNKMSAFSIIWYPKMVFSFLKNNYLMSITFLE